MKDGDVVRIARQIDTHMERIRELVREIRDGDHPHAEEIYDRLDDNAMFSPSEATHVVITELEHPDRWEAGWWGIRRKKSG